MGRFEIQVLELGESGTNEKSVWGSVHFELNKIGFLCVWLSCVKTTTNKTTGDKVFYCDVITLLYPPSEKPESHRFANAKS